MSAGRIAFPQLGSFSIQSTPEIAHTRAPKRLGGRIQTGEVVTVAGRAGSWRVLEFTRDGAHLVALRSLNRTELRGVEYKRLVRS